MSLSDSKERKKEQKLAAKNAKKGQYAAGGTFPPEPPARPWYGDPNWVKVAVSIAALLVASGTLYHQLSRPSSTGATVAGQVEQEAAASSSVSVGQESGGEHDTIAEVVALRPALPRHGLEYEELVTGGGDPDAPLPLIIAAHGLGDRPDRFKKLFLELPFAARVIVPRAPGEYHKGYTWFATEFAEGRVKSMDYEDMRDSAQRLAWLAEDLAAQWPTVGKPVITGFSQGGMLSFVVAASYPESVVGAIPMSGIWPQEMRPEGPLKHTVPLPQVVALHGQEDLRVPFAAAKESVEALKELGVDARLQSYTYLTHRISAEMRASLFLWLERLLAGNEVAYLTSAM